MSDAPAHHLFCLLGPVDPAQSTLPEVLCFIQVSELYVASIAAKFIMTPYAFRAVFRSNLCQGETADQTSSIPYSYT